MIKILDGPMGTELDRLGSDTSLPLWSARSLIEDPDLVRQIHEDFITSGSDIITTNTFRTQDRTLKLAKSTNFNGKELTSLAIQLAKEARINKGNCLIAGSVAPLEDCYSPNLVPNNTILDQEHSKLIQNIVENEVDVILIETMNTIREAKVAYNATLEYPDIPVYVSFTCDENGMILGGDSWNDVTNYFNNKVDTILVNCSSLNSSLKAIESIKLNNVESWGVYPNFGEIDTIKGWKPGLIDSQFENFFNLVLKQQPSIIGTCCGATPHETVKLRKLISHD